MRVRLKRVRLKSIVVVFLSRAGGAPDAARRPRPPHKSDEAQRRRQLHRRLARFVGGVCLARFVGGVCCIGAWPGSWVVCIVDYPPVNV